MEGTLLLDQNQSVAGGLSVRPPFTLVTLNNFVLIARS